MAAERILIVDDDPLNLKLTGSLLVREGFEVQVANDGQQALAVVASFRPHLMLSDIQLPRIDGLELARRLRSGTDSRNLVIIALTAYGMKGDEERAMEAGCDDFITKPIDPRRLSGILRRHLDEMNHASSQAPAPVPSNPTTGLGSDHGVIDIADFKMRVGGDQGLMNDLIHLLLADAPELAAATRKAALEKDNQALKDAAHKLKGSVATFSAPRAYQAACVLEEMGAGGDLSQAIGAVETLQGELTLLFSELAKIAKETTPA